MPKLLTEAQIRQYRDNGYAYPARVLTAGEAASCRGDLEAFERAQGHALNGTQRAKTYLLFTWAYEILTHPKVLDAVEDLIGPNLLCFHWTTWIKEPRTPGYVSWHQDATYFGLEPAEQVTAWVALTPATPENGCLQVLPGSHSLGQLPIELRPNAENLLSSGQEVVLSFDAANTVRMPLQPGEMSLHHTYAVHGSGANLTDDRRIGFGISYIPTHVRQTAGERCSAMLVRGKDSYGHFVPEAPPRRDGDDDARETHAAAIGRYRAAVRSLGHLTAARHD